MIKLDKLKGIFKKGKGGKGGNGGWKSKFGKGKHDDEDDYDDDDDSEYDEDDCEDDEYDNRDFNQGKKKSGFKPDNGYKKNGSNKDKSYRNGKGSSLKYDKGHSDSKYWERAEVNGDLNERDVDRSRSSPSRSGRIVGGDILRGGNKVHGRPEDCDEEYDHDRDHDKDHGRSYHDGKDHHFGKGHGWKNETDSGRDHGKAMAKITTGRMEKIMIETTTMAETMTMTIVRIMVRITIGTKTKIVMTLIMIALVKTEQGKRFLPSKVSKSEEVHLAMRDLSKLKKMMAGKRYHCCISYCCSYYCCSRT